MTLNLRCCLFLRPGVFFVSVLQFLSNALSAGAVWAFLLGAHTTFRTSSGQHRQVNLGANLNAKSTVAMIVWAIMLTMGTISSLTGLVLLRVYESTANLGIASSAMSTSTRRVLALKLYLFVMAALLGAHLVMGLITVAILGGSKDDFIGWCTEVASDSDAFLDASQWSGGCLDGYRVVLFTSVGALIVPFFVNLYAYWVWCNHANRLGKDVGRDTTLGLSALKQPHRHSKSTSR